jgi:peptidoglycan/xylan/chitin deacetylase (PgdA/CDA1 family)
MQARALSARGRDGRVTRRVRGNVARVFDTALVSRTLASLESRDAGRPGRVAVMMYHRIDEPDARPDLWPGMISASPTRFAQQIELIATRYTPITVSDLLAARRDDRPIPRRAVHVTFDDAYEDFADHAWPTLRHYGVPVTLFVPTGFPDQPQRRFWWDRLHVAITATREPAVRVGRRALSLGSPEERQAVYHLLHRTILNLPHHRAMDLVEGLTRQLGEPSTRPGVLDWTSLRRLDAEGVKLAAHSRLHPRLDRLPPDELHAETIGSYEELRAEVPGAAPVFAYPGGHYDNAALDALRTGQIEIAFCTERRAAQLGRSDWLRLPRINVGQRTGVGILRAQLGSWMRLVGR